MLNWIFSLALFFSEAFGGTWMFFKTQSTAFTPASISNLENWYDCSDTATMTLSGSDITQLNDKSGNARHLTQGTTSKSPDDTASCQNGLHCCRFDGTDDDLAGSLGSDRNTISIVIAAKSSRQRRYDAIFDARAGNTGDMTVEVGFGGNTFDLWVYNVGAHAMTAGTWSASTAFDLMVTYDNATIKTYINNAGGGSQGSSGRYFRQNFTIGSNDPAFYDWKDDIYEIIVYSKVIDSTERTQLRDYLTAKWGY